VATCKSEQRILMTFPCQWSSIASLDGCGMVTCPARLAVPPGAGLSESC
jgi:hypothetical protein